MTGPGRFTEVLILQSTRPATVVLYHSALDHVASTLVFPLQFFTSGYFILSHLSLDTGNQFSVTAGQSNTMVSVKFPYSDGRAISLSVNGFTFNKVQSLTFTLDPYDTVALQSMEDFSGSFVYATKQVVVYVGSYRSQTSANHTDNTLDAALSVDYVANRYVTFPTISGEIITTSWTTTAISAATNTTEWIKVLALYDDTVIRLYGSSAGVYNLSKAGDFKEISLPSTEFYLIESDPYHPIYVTKISVSSQGTCMTSLMPENLWRNQYDFDVLPSGAVVYVVMETNLTTQVYVNGVSTLPGVCRAVNGSTLSGCYLSLGQGYYHLSVSPSSAKFAAYSTHTSANGTGYCNMLGATKQLAPYDVQFPALVYINLKSGMSFPSPLLPETTPVLTTTASTTQTTASTTTVDTTAASTASTISSSTTQDHTTSTETQTTPEDNNTTTGQPCFPYFSPPSNWTMEDAELAMKTIRQSLYLNYRDTFAFRITKFSIWENRVSCHVIGISGVVIITVCVVLILSPDLINLLRFLCSHKKKTEIPSAKNPTPDP